MRLGKMGSLWQRAPGQAGFGMAWICLFVCACSTSSPRKIDRWLLGANRPGVLRDVSRDYVIRSPDVLEVLCAPQAECAGTKVVGIDGTIDLGPKGKMRVDGISVREVFRQLAEKFEVPEEAVFVRVAEHRSQFVYVFGEVVGLQRAVPYQGPETVVEFLKRVGGLTRHASPEKIQVVRPHIAQGKKAEVFAIDLPAIIDQNDQATNIIIEPLDQVYVGQTRRSVWQKCLPPWLQGFFTTSEPAPALEPLEDIVDLAGQVIPDIGPEAPPLPGQPKP
jgi:protein involved in polysaccharide export with SLBB domain